MSEKDNKRNDVSITVIRRLPKYYRYLGDLMDKEVTRISSKELSKLVGFTASQIRQDLNNFGGFGQQGYGYNVEDLYNEVGKILGVDQIYRCVLIGSGNLGHAIVNYKGFTDAGFQWEAFFDRNANTIGTEMKGKKILDVKDLKSYVKENNIDVGVITVPRASAQKIADDLVEAGVRGIWNFAPIDLVVPEDVTVENVRLNESLFTLSYYLK